MGSEASAQLIVPSHSTPYMKHVPTAVTICLLNLASCKNNISFQFVRFPAHLRACIYTLYAVSECVHAHTSSSSTVTYTAVSQTGQLRVLKQSKTKNLFKSCLGAFSVRFLAVWMCLVSHLALLSLDIACIAVARPAKPVYEKWISPSLHCHGDAQLTRQFCPFKYLHQSCCSDGEVRSSLSRDWFHPLLSI